MSIQSLLGLLGLLLPVVKGAVEVAETIGGPRNGADKLAHAVGVVEATLPKIAATAEALAAARAAVPSMIQATVAAANASGAFKRSPRRKARK